MLFLVFKYDASSEDYRPLVDLFLRCGFEPVLLKVHWLRTTLDDLLDEVLLQTDHDSIAECYLSGFSFGALVVFIIACRQPIKGLLLGSL
jgi:hypothetical protein